MSCDQLKEGHDVTRNFASDPVRIFICCDRMKDVVKSLALFWTAAQIQNKLSLTRRWLRLQSHFQASVTSNSCLSPEICSSGYCGLDGAGLTTWHAHSRVGSVSRLERCMGQHLEALKHVQAWCFSSSRPDGTQGVNIGHRDTSVV